MTVVVVLDTVVLALLCLLVVGLLRSHAELLRRTGLAERSEPDLTSSGTDGDLLLSPSLPHPREAGSLEALDVTGEDLEGNIRKITVRGSRDSGTLLAFLTSGCLGCMGFWEEMKTGPPPLPEGVRLVVLTKDSNLESPSRLRDLAPEHVEVLMSSSAWREYHVPGAPYFIHVDAASGEVHSEGSASSWEQVGSLLRDAARDRALAARRPAKATP